MQTNVESSDQTATCNISIESIDKINLKLSHASSIANMMILSCQADAYLHKGHTENVLCAIVSLIDEAQNTLDPIVE